MRIAICDDETSCQELLKKYLTEWAQEKRLSLDMAFFASGEGFLFAWEEDKKFDLLILDIEMGELNGMELAHEIRKEEELLPILFVTGYDEYMSQGYEVDALHYLIKPIHKEKLYAVLNKLQQKKEPEEKLLFQADEGMLSLPMSKIWYVEACGHQCIICVGERIYRLRASISEMEKVFETKKEMIRCHRSYLVNIQHIDAILKTEIVLDNQKRLPVSRGAKKEVQRAFIGQFDIIQS